MLLGIVLFFGTINVIPPKKVMKDNPFIIEKGARPLIAAHRGGKNLNPENTFKAINYAYNNCHIDILEIDVCITKDQHLVLNHNMTIDKATGATDVRINDKYLYQLQQYNFGYNFKDKSGEYPYRDVLKGVSIDQYSTVLAENELRIVTTDELFEKYSSTDLKYIIEIKNSGSLGKTAADKLCGQIKQYGLENKVVIGTFHDEVESYLMEKYPNIMRGASTKPAAKFVITQLLKVNLFDNSSFSALQIPTEYEIKDIEIELDKKTFINRAHRRGISVQYWTINEKDEMRELILLGADVIMTDSPDVMYELLLEMGYYD